MSKLKIKTYELRDTAIMQAPVSFCNHRGDVDNKVEICERKVYPIFVAPMASVTDENNYKTWIENGLTPVVPRSVGQRLSFEERMEIAKETFVSISLKEAQEDFIKFMKDRYGISNICEHDNILIGAIPTHYICIDIAHGTLSELYDACKNIKSIFGDSVEIMTGNVANLDDVYSFYADAGIDWVRAGIGGGSRCVSEGTKIKMADGSLMNVEDISNGDNVLTKNGVHKVINTFTKKVRKVININDEIEVTPNHKFFVIKKSEYHEGMTDEEIVKIGKYIEAQKLSNDFLLVKG